MNDHHPPPPEDAAEARALADSIVAADGPVAPTADDVRAMMRSQNWKFFLTALALLLVGGASVWYSATGRSASQDSAETTAAALADNAREACIHERRSEQLDALGRISISANQAEVAGLVNDDPEEAQRQLSLFAGAVADWTAATESLTPAILDRPRPEGCGPPILAVEDIPTDDE